jgi:hypothetical protein
MTMFNSAPRSCVFHHQVKIFNSTVHHQVNIFNSSVSPTSPYQQQKRHRFVRVVLIDTELRQVSTVHFVDLGNRHDVECRRDLDAVNEMLESLADGSYEFAASPKAANKAGNAGGAASQTPDDDGNASEGVV